MRKVFYQKGRTLVEMIAVIILMAIISLAVYALLRVAVDKANAKTLEQEIQTRVVQLRHQALTKTGIIVETRAHIMEASGLAIRTLEVDDTTFTLRVGSNGTPLDYSLCQRLMKSASFSPENSDACHENQTYSDFVFPKFGGLRKFGGEGSDIISGGESGSEELDCGDHAHQSGNKCVCDEGFYGNHCDSFCNGFMTDYDECLPCSTEYVDSVSQPEDCTKVCQNRRVKTIDDGEIWYVCALKECPKGYISEEEYGDCIACDSKYPIIATADQCSQCDGTENQRIMIGNTCMLDKNCDGFYSSDGECYPCNTPSTIWSTKDLCGMCDDSPTPRLEINNYCVLDKNCPEMTGENGECYSCADLSDIDTSIEQCHRCENRFYFPGGGGMCKECSTKGYAYFHNQEECDRCSKVGYPHIKVGSYCVLETACEGGVLDTQGNCKLCSYQWGIITSEEQCQRCDDTSTPRMMINGFCVLDVECDGYLTANGTCHSCSETSSGMYNGTSREQCHRCDNHFYADGVGEGMCQPCSTTETGNNITTHTKSECDRCDNTDTPRMMLGNKCVLKKECNGGFLGENGNCYLCSDTKMVETTEDQCDICSNRVYEGRYCVLKSGCNGFWDYSGNCHSCSETSRISTSQEQCNRCENHWTEWVGGGYCRHCSDTTGATSIQTECDRCKNSSTPRVMIHSQYCVLDNCDDGWLDSSGTCHACSDTASAYSDMDQCKKCDNTDTPRDYVGNYCKLRETWVAWTQPTLTSNSSYGTLTASAAQGADATSCTSSNHPAFCAFDGQIGPANTKWYHGSSSSGYLIWHLPVQLKVSSVQVYTTSESCCLNRFPSSITIYGSNDGTSWTQIGSASGYTKPSSSQAITVSCNSSNSYEYLKWEFTNSINNLAVSEIKITAQVLQSN